MNTAQLGLRCIVCRSVTNSFSSSLRRSSKDRERDTSFKYVFIREAISARADDVVLLTEPAHSKLQTANDLRAEANQSALSQRRKAQTGTANSTAVTT